MSFNEHKNKKKNSFVLSLLLLFFLINSDIRAEYTYWWAGNVYNSYSEAVDAASVYGYLETPTLYDQYEYYGNGYEFKVYQLWGIKWYGFYNSSGFNGWPKNTSSAYKSDSTAGVIANVLAAAQSVCEANLSMNGLIVNMTQIGPYSRETNIAPIDVLFAPRASDEPCAPTQNDYHTNDQIRAYRDDIRITAMRVSEYYIASNEDHTHAACEGDPCDPATGKNFQTEQDINLASLGVNFSRHYQSLRLGENNSDIGINWQHSFSKKMNTNLDGAYLPSQTAVKSTIYSTPTDACLSGWTEIKDTAYRGTLIDATANYVNGACNIEKEGVVKATVVLHSMDNSTPSPNDPFPAQRRSFTRPDGNIFTFTLQNDVWISLNGNNISLEQVGDEWLLIDENNTQEIYSEAGNLLRIVKLNGHTTNLSYDASDNLVLVTGPFGQTIEFTYDTQNRIATVTGPNGLISYTYDTNNNLTQVDYPDGNTKIYAYQDVNYPNHLTELTNENGDIYATWDYDAQGRAIANELTGGVERVEFNYNPDGTTTVTNSRGAVRTYEFDTFNAGIRVTNITGDPCTTCPNGDLISRSYDDNGYLNRTVDWGGKITSMINDASGRIVSRTEAEGTSEERLVEYTYDDRFVNKTSSISEPSVVSGKDKVTTYTYDELGNLISTNVAGFAPNGSGGDVAIEKTTLIKYEGPLNQISEIDGPRPNSIVNDLTQFTYYPDDILEGDNRAQLSKVTGPNNIILRDDLQYSPSGKVISESRPNGVVLDYIYYAGNDRLESMTETSGGVSRTTRWTYIATGEVASVTQAFGTSLANTISFEYDAAKRLTGVVDNFGNKIVYTLDTEGNKIQEEIKDINNTLYRTLQRTFDIYNRLDQQTTVDDIVDNDFSVNGTLTNQVNAKGVQASYEYDALQRLTSVTQDVSGTDLNTQDTLTQYGYDASNNLTSVTTPNNAQTTYVYDDLGNLLEENSADRGTITYTYDEAGNRLTATDARGITATYTYDALNRVTSIDYPGTEEDVTYVYDSTATCLNGIGKLCQITDQSGTTDYSYDVFGRTVLQEKLELGVTYTTRYSFNILDQMTSMTLPSGRVIDYGYDAKGRLTHVDATLNGTAHTIVHNILYRADDLLSSREFGNGFVEQRLYNLKGQLTSLTTPLLTAITNPPPTTPAFEIRVNAGGTEYTDSVGQIWAADYGFNTGFVGSPFKTIAGTSEQPLFDKNHYDLDPTPELTYSFGVPNGDYTVRLYFAETYDAPYGAGVRVFDIDMEGQRVWTNLDVFGQVGAETQLLKENVITVSDGQLDIEFLHGLAGHPMVSAIEVIGRATAPPPPPPVTDTQPPTIPSGLTATTIGASQIALDWAASSDLGGNSVAGYKIFRDDNLIATVTATQYTDAGLTANTTYHYAVSAFDSAVPSNESSTSSVASATTLAQTLAEIRVNAGGAEYTDSVGQIWAADYGFNTGFVGSPFKTIAGTSEQPLFDKNHYDLDPTPELSYSFGVPNGDYTVRLYFAETYDAPYGAGVRVFDIDMEGQRVWTNLDVFGQVGAETQLLKENVITVSDGQLDIEFLHGLAGHPMVSAIEILQIPQVASVNTNSELAATSLAMSKPTSIAKLENVKNVGHTKTIDQSQLMVVSATGQPYLTYRKGKETQGQWIQTAEDPNAYDRPDAIAYVSDYQMKQWNDNQLLSSVTNAKPWLANLKLGDAANEPYEYIKVAHGTAAGTVSIDSEAVIYSYDANGNVASITGLNDSYAYSNDALDRLTDDMSTSGGNITYDYDRNGNRTDKTLDSVSGVYSYELDSNRLSTDPVGTMTHDAAGNRTSDNNGARTFTYNNAGRLWQVYENSILVATYTYNALGQRTRKVTDQGTTFYHYDLNGKLISETTDFFASAKDYVYMGNTPVAQIDIGLTTETVNYLHTDHLNTPRRATNQAGNIVWAWDGDAFGQTIANEDPIGSGTNTTISLRFAGQYFDQETALHYNYFRYYDPSSGRYITSDPIGLEGGMNTFGYVGGNPNNWIDPYGLFGLNSIRDYAIKKFSDWMGKKSTPGPVEQAMIDTLTDHFNQEYNDDIRCGMGEANARIKLEQKMKELEGLEFNAFPDLLHPKDTFEEYEEKIWPEIKNRIDELMP